VIANATLVTMNTKRACDAMRGAYPQYANKIEVVRNGSDTDLLPPTRRDRPLPPTLCRFDLPRSRSAQLLQGLPSG
jgi:hypothetical protein